MVIKESILNEIPSEMMGYPLTIKQQIWICFILPPILNCIIYMFDFAGCIAAVYHHHDAGLPMWALTTVFFLYLPSFVFFLLVVTDPEAWDELQGDRKGTGRWLMFRIIELLAFPFWVLYRYAKRIFWSIEALRTEDPEREEALTQASESSQIELFLYLHSFLQCGPQSLLQLFIMLYCYSLGLHISSSLVLVIVTSIAIMATTTVSFHRFESQKPGGKVEPWKKVSIVERSLLRASMKRVSSNLRVERQARPTTIKHLSTIVKLPLIVHPLTPPADKEMSFLPDSPTDTMSPPKFAAPPRPISNEDDTKTSTTDEVDLPGRKQLIKVLEEDEALGKAIAFFWWVFHLLFRITSLATFAHFYLGAAFGVAAFHYILMAAILLYYSRFPSVYKVFLQLCIAFVYIFSIIEYKTKFRITTGFYGFYFTLVAIENVSITVSWYNFMTWEGFWYNYIFCCIMVSSAISLLAMSVYFYIFKPRSIYYDPV